MKLLAPDCKTLSRARDIAIPGVPNAPRSLRSDEFPEGLPGLTPELQRRVDLGNEMFEGAIVIADGCSNSGTGFVVENPLAQLWMASSEGQEVAIQAWSEVHQVLQLYEGRISFQD